MNVLVIGWYGTETIGDRAILSSLIRHFSSVCECNFTIASIYPFYTERTIIEDEAFISKISSLNNKTLSINIIDSRKPLEMNRAIKRSDCVVMGGGPLDDMASMYMIEYAVLTAKKYKKKILMYGIGMNVLKNKTFIKVANTIVCNSDCVIFRDSISRKLCDQYGFRSANKSIVLIDPALFSCYEYKKSSVNNKSGDYIAINLRKFPHIYLSGAKDVDVDFRAQSICLSMLNKETEIKLVPMNCFDVGIDDRIILNEFYMNNSHLKMHVENKPLTLEETMDIFACAQMCIGMRFHSVVFQTILNGNNYILDYTNPQKGKIMGFINQIYGYDFYKSRIVSLQSEENIYPPQLNENKFELNENLIQDYDHKYIRHIRKLLCIK